MRRDPVGRALAGISCAGLLGTAALHGTGYPSIARAAARVQGVLGAAIPALWLRFSLDLLVVGLIVGTVAARPGRSARVILGLAALCPLGAAGLQIRFIGFVGPTAILLVVAAATIAAAAVGPEPPDTRVGG